MPAMTQREQKPSVSTGLSGTPMLGTRRGVQADSRGGGQVQALGLAVDGNSDSLVGERHEFGGKPPTLGSEPPPGPPRQPVLAAPLVKPLPPLPLPRQPPH